MIVPPNSVAHFLGAGRCFRLVLAVVRRPRRVAAKDVFVAYQPILEDAILPQPNDLYLAIKELAQY